MRSRLSGWKGKLLNKAGRLTLSKAVLSVMSVYNMQSVWMPVSTCDDIDKLIRNFIWNKGENRGVNLVNWSNNKKKKPSELENHNKGEIPWWAWSPSS